MNFKKALPPKMLKDKINFYEQSEYRVGWHGDMDRCWIDEENHICVCSRLIRTEKFGKIEHVTITKDGGLSTDISWACKQEIKNILFGEDRFAIEVYPKEKNLVDVSNVYHLWVFDKNKDMPFGITKKEYTKAINRGYDSDINKYI